MQPNLNLTNTSYLGKNLIEWLILLCSAGLIAIWPLPGTIAVRHLLLGLGSLTSLFYLFSNRALILRGHSWPIWLLLTFFGWLLIHLIFFFHEKDLQLRELSSVWMRTFLSLPLGLSLGSMLNLSSGQLQDSLLPSGGGRKSIFTHLITPILFISFLGTFLIFFSRYAYEVYFTHQLIHFPFYEIPYRAKTPFVIAGALSLPLCFLLISRSLRESISKWWIVIALFGVAFALFGVYFANTKNGMVIFTICLTLSIAHFLLSLDWTFRKIVLGIPVISLVLLMGAYGIGQHLKVNDAWENLSADIQVAKNVGQITWWKDAEAGPAPINSRGVPVNVSTYQRTAWLIVGYELLIENPLGFGLVHHSFGWLAETKWLDFAKPIGGMRGATHSAWLDFALGVGIPGLLLVLIPLWVSWYRSLFQEGLWFSYASWTIPIMSFAYLTAETNEAHFIELLFFMTALFCGLTIQKPRK